MSFLKKLGQILGQVGATWLGISPIVTPLFGAGGNKVAGEIGTVVNDFTAIGTTVIQVETALQGQSGAAKLQAAINLIGPIIKTSQLVSGKKIADAALLEKGIGEVTQGMVDILNSIHEDSADKVIQQ